MGCQAHLYRETDAASMPCAPWRYALNQPIVILHYLRLTFFPRGLCLHYHWPGAATFAEMVVPGLALLALLAATAWCAVRRPALGFVAGSFFLALSVTSSVIPVFDMIFEHRMYLSLAAMAVLVVLGAFDVLNVLLPLPVGSPRRWWLHALPVALAVAALAATTYDRNFAYAGLVDMWQDVAVKCPRNEIAQKCLGIGFVEQHRYEESIAAFRRALKLADALPVAPAPAWLAEVHTNLGASLVNTGRLAEAMRSYEEAVRIDPAYAGAYVNMGTLFGRLGDLARRGSASRRPSRDGRSMRRRITTWACCWRAPTGRPLAAVIKRRFPWTRIMPRPTTCWACPCCGTAIGRKPSSIFGGR